MTSVQFIDLIVVQGPNQGMCYSTLENMFRVIGRYEKGYVSDSRILNPDQQEQILKHLPIALNFERGPDILLDDPILSTAHGLVSYCSKEPVWINLLTDEKKTIKKNDVISIGNTKLKVS